MKFNAGFWVAKELMGSLGDVEERFRFVSAFVVFILGGFKAH